ncbi:MAG: serine/threonine-protein kinase [Polyangiaceae bacterium]
MSVRVGRYIIYERIAGGGMASVHLARALGPLGFEKIVAVKRLHPSFASDAELSLMLLDEARLSARVHHPYVVPTLDVVHEGNELLLVMEYVHGESLARLMKRAKERHLEIDARVAAAVIAQTLRGLHAAHEATDASGARLELVHRDVSPQNVIVGADGLARVLDFGIAKALGRLQTTRDGQVKGKVAYMSPEQLRGQPVDRRTDIFAAFTVLWELLTGERLFAQADDAATMWRVFQGEIPPPSKHAQTSAALDEVVLRGLARERDARFATALEAAEALERAIPLASPSEVAAWVGELVGSELERQKARVADLERDEDAEPARPLAESEPTKRHGVEASFSAEVATATPPETSPKRSRAALALVAAAALFASIGAVVFVMRRGADPTSSAAPSTQAENAEPSAPSAPLSPAVVAPAPTSTATTSSTAASTSTVTLASGRAPSGPQSTAIATARASAVVTTTARAPVKGPDCSNPYVLDSAGRRRYRRECLQP